MTIVERTIMGPDGRLMQGVFLRASPFRGLLMAQRHAGLSHSRFRCWRFQLNYESQHRADMREIYAHLQGPRGPQLKVIAGGRDPDEPRDPRHWQEVRDRWREVDGFAKIGDRNPYEC